MEDFLENLEVFFNKEKSYSDIVPYQMAIQELLVALRKMKFVVRNNPELKRRTITIPDFFGTEIIDETIQKESRGRDKYRHKRKK